MRISVLMLSLMSLFCCGCQWEPTSTQGPSKVLLREVTLKSHLGGELDADPKLSNGELFSIVPDSSEPYSTHKPVTVKLPVRTPYTGRDSLYFLYGYAVGQSSFENNHILCHSNSTPARQHKSWNEGWVAGFEARQKQADTESNRESKTDY